MYIINLFSLLDCKTRMVVVVDTVRKWQLPETVEKIRV